MVNEVIAYLILRKYHMFKADCIPQRMLEAYIGVSGSAYVDPVQLDFSKCCLRLIGCR